MRSAARSLGLLALPLLALVLASCGTGQPSRPNVVLIVIDTLRADHLPFYGYGRNTASFLASLAAEGAVFDRAYSVSSWTAPATASIVTSLHPIQHGVLTGIAAVQASQQLDPTVVLPRIPDGVETIAEAFAAAGYATCAVSDNPNVTRAMGFDQGFESFWNTNDEGAQVINGGVKRWFAERKDKRPYFLYLHYMDPHRPYTPRAPWYKPKSGELAISLEAYDSEISFVDRNIRELNELLKWGRGTIIVVTSDHGEEFQEHGGWDHGRTLYDEVVHVPLVIWHGDDQMAARRVAEPVSLLDITPTLRAAGGLPPSPQDQGVNLLPAARGETGLDAGRLILADLRCAPWFDSYVRKSALRSGQKFILTLPDQRELFDLAADPLERDSLAQQRPQVVEDLAARLAAFEHSCRKYSRESVVDTLDAETLRKLKSLGYVH